MNVTTIKNEDLKNCLQQQTEIKSRDIFELRILKI